MRVSLHCAFVSSQPQKKNFGCVQCLLLQTMYVHVSLCRFRIVSIRFTLCLRSLIMCNNVISFVGLPLPFRFFFRFGVSNASCCFRHFHRDVIIHLDWIVSSFTIHTLDSPKICIVDFYGVFA